MTDPNLDDANIGTRLEIKIKADSHLLHDESLMREFLLGMVQAIGARPLRAPEIDNVPVRLRELGEEPWADEGGITGFITLSVSHISMSVLRPVATVGYAAAHTWPKHDGTKIIDEDGEAVITVYSCRPFDASLATRVVTEKYKPGRMQVIDRSVDLRWMD